MRHTTHKKPMYQPVPEHLRPIADQVAATRLPLNRARLDAALATHADGPTPGTRINEVRALRLLAQRATDLGADVHHNGDLAISIRSHALVELSGLRYSYHLYADYLDLPAGHTPCSVELTATPFAALAHLADDDQLAAAVASSDVYTWVAGRLGVHRTEAKQGLYGLLAGLPDDVIRRRITAAGRDADTVMPKLATIPALFPATFAYGAHLAPYGGPLPLAQAATNRVVNTGLARAHQLLVDAGVPATAAILLDEAAVLYLVPDTAADRFHTTLAGLTVTGEGFTLPVRTD